MPNRLFVRAYLEEIAGPSRRLSSVNVSGKSNISTLPTPLKCFSMSTCVPKISVSLALR